MYSSGDDSRFELYRLCIIMDKVSQRQCGRVHNSLSVHTLEGANSRGGRGYVCDANLEVIDLEVASAFKDIVCHEGYSEGREKILELRVLSRWVHSKPRALPQVTEFGMFGYIFVGRLTFGAARLPVHNATSTVHRSFPDRTILCFSFPTRRDEQQTQPGAYLKG